MKKLLLLFLALAACNTTLEPPREVPVSDQQLYIKGNDGEYDSDIPRDPRIEIKANGVYKSMSTNVRLVMSTYDDIAQYFTNKDIVIYDTITVETMPQKTSEHLTNFTNTMSFPVEPWLSVQEHTNDFYVPPLPWGGNTV